MGNCLGLGSNGSTGRLAGCSGAGVLPAGGDLALPLAADRTLDMAFEVSTENKDISEKDRPHGFRKSILLVGDA